MTAGGLLSAELLEALAKRWRSQGAPIAECLAPGLSEGAMEELVGRLGLRLPSEARTWWGWRNGVPAGNVWREVERSLGPDMPFLPLEEAIERYRSRRRMLAEVDGEYVDYIWPTERLLVTESSATIVCCDCSVEPGAPSPIFAQHAHDWDVEGYEKPKTPSFGEMVTWWIDALDEGGWSFDTGKGVWDCDYDRLDPERELTGLL